MIGRSGSLWCINAYNQLHPIYLACTVRRFFIRSAQIHNSQAVLSGSEFHHLHHVLRLQTGDRVILRDEHGTEYHGTIAQCSSDTAKINLTNLTTSTSLASSSFSLTLAFGLLKGQKMDLVIEKATELGVQTIMPFVSTWTVATIPPQRQTDRLARWQRIAQSAAKQSGSPVPSINTPCSFDQLLADIPPTAHRLLFYEHEQALTLRTFASSHQALSSLWIVIGPEGGFTAREVQRARGAGFSIASLGPSILRAETASIAAVSLCQHLWR